MQKDEKKNSSLEREVITAVTALYLFIVGALLGIHYMAPWLQKQKQLSALSAAPATVEKPPAAPANPSPAPQQNRTPAKKKTSNGR
jgi:hypothetical protein